MNVTESQEVITIIMATFNRAHLIEESLESIQNQSFPNWACLIIDDGSTDNTREVVENKIAGDRRFTFLKRPSNYKKGLSGCRNYGLDVAKGEFIIFFDDDDIVHPENLKICIEHLYDKHLSFCRYEKEPFIGKLKPKSLRSDQGFERQFIDVKDLENMVTGKLPFASCTVLWRKECFKENRFNEELLYAEEWECYTRILSMGFKGVSIDKVLYYNRKHLKSNTGEFFNNDPVRRGSKIKAIKLVINNLSQKGLLSTNLIQYFIKIGFLMKEYSIIEYVLNYSKPNIFMKLKYKLGFKYYLLIRPILLLKSKFKKIN